MNLFLNIVEKTLLTLVILTQAALEICKYTAIGATIVLVSHLFGIV